MDMFAELFPRNGCLCWLHNSVFQQTRHNNNNNKFDYVKVKAKETAVNFLG
jgi:hypothetical protein